MLREYRASGGISVSFLNDRQVLDSGDVARQGEPLPDDLNQILRPDIPLLPVVALRFEISKREVPNLMGTGKQFTSPAEGYLALILPKIDRPVLRAG